MSEQSQMSTSQAREILENPANRLEHLGASLFVTSADVSDWFDNYPDMREHSELIARGYTSAAIMSANGELFV